MILLSRERATLVGRMSGVAVVVLLNPVGLRHGTRRAAVLLNDEGIETTQHMISASTRSVIQGATSAKTCGLTGHIATIATGQERSIRPDYRSCNTAAHTHESMRAQLRAA